MDCGIDLGVPKKAQRERGRKGSLVVPGRAPCHLSSLLPALPPALAPALPPPLGF